MARRVLEEDLKNIEFETSEDVDVTPTFDHMGLREDLLRGIYAYGQYFVLAIKLMRNVFMCVFDLTIVYFVFQGLKSHRQFNKGPSNQ